MGRVAPGAHVWCWLYVSLGEISFSFFLFLPCLSILMQFPEICLSGWAGFCNITSPPQPCRGPGRSCGSGSPWSPVLKVVGNALPFQVLTKSGRGNLGPSHSFLVPTAADSDCPFSSVIHFLIEIMRENVLTPTSANFWGFFFPHRIKILEFLLIMIPFNLKESKLKLRGDFSKVVLPGIYLHL